MQDQITQMLLCVAVGCALSPVVAAALVPPQSGRNWLAALLPRVLIAAGPVYLELDYVLYQGTAVVTCAAAGFALGLWVLRGWWAPVEQPAVSPGWGERIHFAAPAPVFDLAGRRRTAAARALLRERMLNVVRDDRRPDDRSMPSAA